MLTISTHILDTSRGLPAVGIPVTLETWHDDRWDTLGHGISDADGRVRDWGTTDFTATGMYCLTFVLRDYFSSQNQAAFFPEVRLQFQSDGILSHLHVPLLLNPYGYSTYRGS